MPSKKDFPAKFSPADFHSLLRTLAEDDTARKAFRDDPLEILARHNIEIDPEAIPARVTLPSKKELRKALARIPAGAGFSEIIAFLFFFVGAVPTSKKR